MLVHVFFRGGFGGRVIPGLFSNPVVKSSYADGTALWWGGRVGCCHGFLCGGGGLCLVGAFPAPSFSFLFGWVCEHVKVGVGGGLFGGDDTTKPTGKRLKNVYAIPLSQPQMLIEKICCGDLVGILKM